MSNYCLWNAQGVLVCKKTLEGFTAKPELQQPPGEIFCSLIQNAGKPCNPDSKTVCTRIDGCGICRNQRCTPK